MIHIDIIYIYKYQYITHLPRLSCVLIRQNCFLIHAVQVEKLAGCPEMQFKCHISYHVLFCPYLPWNPSKQNWQNGLCYFFWSCLLVNKVYTFKWILLCIIFRLCYTFAAGTDTKNCHKVCSLSTHNSCFKNLDVLHIFMFFLFKRTYFENFGFEGSGFFLWIEVGIIIIKFDRKR